MEGSPNGSAPAEVRAGQTVPFLAGSANIPAARLLSIYRNGLRPLQQGTVCQVRAKEKGAATFPLHFYNKRHIFL